MSHRTASQSFCTENELERQKILIGIFRRIIYKINFLRYYVQFIHNIIFTIYDMNHILYYFLFNTTPISTEYDIYLIELSDKRY